MWRCRSVMTTNTGVCSNHKVLQSVLQNAALQTADFYRKLSSSQHVAAAHLELQGFVSRLDWTWSEQNSRDVWWRGLHMLRPAGVGRRGDTLCCSSLCGTHRHAADAADEYTNWKQLDLKQLQCWESCSQSGCCCVTWHLRAALFKQRRLLLTVQVDLPGSVSVLFGTRHIQFFVHLWAPPYITCLSVSWRVKCLLPAAMQTHVESQTHGSLTFKDGFYGKVGNNVCDLSLDKTHLLVLTDELQTSLSEVRTEIDRCFLKATPKVWSLI